MTSLMVCAIAARLNVALVRLQQLQRRKGGGGNDGDSLIW